MRNTLRVGLALVALAAGSSVVAQAQNSASIAATATVLRALQVTASGSLDFGQVVVGANRSIASSSGALFTVAGTEGASITRTFTLPADLGSPNVTMSAWEGRRGETNAYASGTVVTIDETATADAFGGTAGGAADANLYFWLGATVNVAAAATPGSYTNNVTLTVNYN